MKNYLHLASNGLGFNESGVRFYAGVILLHKNPYPLNFKSYQSLISCKNLFNSGSDKLLR
jgi:hypothetical protein